MQYVYSLNLFVSMYKSWEYIRKEMYIISDAETVPNTRNYYTYLNETVPNTRIYYKYLNETVPNTRIYYTYLNETV